MSDANDSLTVIARHFRRLTMATWAAVTLGAVAVLLLLVLGRGRGIWGSVAGVLVLSCVGVCTWAALRAQRDINQVNEAVQRFVSERARLHESSGEGSDTV